MGVAPVVGRSLMESGVRRHTGCSVVAVRRGDANLPAITPETVLEAGDTVVVTHKESGGWRELLSGAGVKSAAISGSGVFRDAGTDERARQLFFDGETPDFQVVIPDFGTMTGAFQIASIDYAGSHDGEASFEIALVSAGPVRFEAAL